VKIATHWDWVSGWVADANLLTIIGPMAMLAAAPAGAPPASRDPPASASAPAVRKYLWVRRSKTASRYPLCEAPGGP
jgi:hypothetical protein